MALVLRQPPCLRPDSERTEEKDGEPCRDGSCTRPNDSGQPPKINPENPSNLLPGQPQGFAPTDLSTLFPPSGGYPFRDYPLSSNLYPSHWLVIGDVSGHGVPAGLIMMMVQTAIKTVSRTNPQYSPLETLTKVNEVLLENIKRMDEDKYMTITLMNIQADGQIYYSGLHQDILVYRAQKAQVEIIETRGIWLGIMDQIHDQLKVDTLQLQPGDVMLLYTDGIIEATDADQTMYSDQKLMDILIETGNQPLPDIKETILNSLKNYSCHDDITFMIIKKGCF